MTNSQHFRECYSQKSSIEENRISFHEFLPSQQFQSLSYFGSETMNTEESVHYFGFEINYSEEYPRGIINFEISQIKTERYDFCTILNAE